MSLRIWRPLRAIEPRERPRPVRLTERRRRVCPGGARERIGEEPSVASRPAPIQPHPETAVPAQLIQQSAVWAIHQPSAGDLAHQPRTQAAAPYVRDAANFDTANGSAERPAAGQSIAVIPVAGVLTPHGSFHGPSTRAIDRAVRQAMAQPGVQAIVLDIDSPGGAVAGVPELAGTIRAARAQKPIIAVANHLAASGAYWLASQASELVTTPSALLGSIGVVALHEDMSGWLEQLGLRISLIGAGSYKTEGNPFEPLTDDARAHLQTLVDDAYGQFVRDVAEGRGRKAADVRAGFGEGRIVPATTAVALGMADRIASVDDVIEGLLRSQRRVTSTRQRAGALTTTTTDVVAALRARLRGGA